MKHPVYHFFWFFQDCCENRFEDSQDEEKQFIYLFLGS